MTDYADATPAVSDLLGELIPEHHSHLVDQRIEFVFVDPTPKSKGRYVLGRARKVSGLNAWLASSVRVDQLVEPPPFFVVEISKRPWLMLERAERVALLDHELSHCVVDEEEGTIGIVGHDVEEFIAVLERRGAWRPELADFLDAGRQLKLVR